jgi:hypothetical protein
MADGHDSNQILGSDGAISGFHQTYRRKELFLKKTNSREAFPSGCRADLTSE